MAMDTNQRPSAPRKLHIVDLSMYCIVSPQGLVPALLLLLLLLLELLLEA